MLWLGRLCSLLIADSSLAGYCQPSAHLEAVFLLLAAGMLHAVSFTVGLRSRSSCYCFLRGMSQNCPPLLPFGAAYEI